jgi:NitT/TauT family transport system permease protein
VFGVWAAAALLVDKPFLPGPVQTLRALADLFASGALLVHAGASAGRVFWALIAGGLPATALGLAAGRCRPVDRIVSPLAYVLHPLPKVAFLPLIMLLFGIGEISKIVLVASIVFSQLLVSSRDASRRVSARLLDSVRSLGGKRWDLALRVVLPAAAPDLLTALRVSLGTAIAVLFLAETFASESGLGFLIVDAWSRLAYPEMYAAILALSLLGLGFFALIDGTERLVCPWRAFAR